MDRIIVIDEKNLNELKTEIAEAVIEGMKSLNGVINYNHSNSEWVNDAEAKEILGYRSKTKMQELRNSRAIVYSKFGRKIKYHRQSLIDYIEKNKKTKWNHYGI